MEALAAQVQAIASRIGQLQGAVGQRAAEHQQLHPVVTHHSQQVQELHTMVVSVQGMIAAGRSTGGGDTEMRKRLDRMVEARANISTYNGRDKGAGFREWADDVRDHVGGHDAKLARAMSMAGAATGDITQEEWDSWG